MKLTRMIDNYISDKKYSMTYRGNSLDIVNYTEILDFSDVKISIRHSDKVYHIEGDNLVISRMMDNEILITGNIKTIIFS